MLEEIYCDYTVADDMYNYQRALLEYEMVIINFLDAISEGDGAKLLRNWKFLLLYFQHDTGSQKYSLEALYLMFQVYALPSPKAAHNLIWNRFSKRKHSRGENIPLDLALEFLNRIFKGAVKKLGPNANPKYVHRICNPMNVTKKLTENFDNSMALYKRSGKHSHKSASADLKTLVIGSQPNSRKTFGTPTVDAMPCTSCPISVFLYVNNSCFNSAFSFVLTDLTTDDSANTVADCVLSSQMVTKEVLPQLFIPTFTPYSTNIATLMRNIVTTVAIPKLLHYHLQ